MVDRIAKFAFDYATRHGRKKVTAVHKANIMKLGDGLFLNCCKEVAALYPQAKFENMIVDNTTMQLVSNPQQFDVMVRYIISSVSIFQRGRYLMPGDAESLREHH